MIHLRERERERVGAQNYAKELVLRMAYIPPHKRNSKESDALSPTPFLSVEQKRNPRQPISKTVPSTDAIYKWFVLPSVHSVQLKEFPYEPLERKDGRKPMILVSPDHLQKEANGEAGVIVKLPWESVVEKIQQDLLNTLQIARSKMCEEGPELNKPNFVIRFGKILFRGAPVSLDGINDASAVEHILSRLKRGYNTSVPHLFSQAILTEFVPKMGFDLHKMKEYYLVKVIEKSRPEETLLCACRLIKDNGALDVYKIERDKVRRLVVDISCLDKNLDLRLALSSRRVLTSPTDDEKHSLISLVKSAVIDSDVMGGLRWPLGKDSIDGRYTVVGVGQAKGTIFRTSDLKLKVRHVDRFDFTTSIGEVSQEAGLWIPEFTKKLRDETLELDPLVGMVSKTFKLAWEHFLSWEGSFM